MNGGDQKSDTEGWEGGGKAGRKYERSKVYITRLRGYTEELTEETEIREGEVWVWNGKGKWHTERRINREKQKGRKI